jgi:hypothetical protein
MAAALLRRQSKRFTSRRKLTDKFRVKQGFLPRDTFFCRFIDSQSGKMAASKRFDRGWRCQATGLLTPAQGGSSGGQSGPLLVWGSSATRRHPRPGCRGGRRRPSSGIPRRWDAGCRPGRPWSGCSCPRMRRARGLCLAQLLCSTPPIVPGPRIGFLSCWVSTLSPPYSTASSSPRSSGQRQEHRPRPCAIAGVAADCLLVPLVAGMVRSGRWLE